MTDLPQAADMRAQLNRGETEKARAQLEKIAQDIRAAAALGRNGVQVVEFQPGVRAKLEEAGYKISKYTPDPRDRDPREYAYYSVTW